MQGTNLFIGQNNIIHKIHAGNRGLGKSNDLPKVIQLQSDRASI